MFIYISKYIQHKHIYTHMRAHIPKTPSSLRLRDEYIDDDNKTSVIMELYAAAAAAAAATIILRTV
jgi:hypothetical protein